METRDIFTEQQKQIINRELHYKVKATSALHGTIRVRDKLKFTFDIAGRRV